MMLKARLFITLTSILCISGCQDTHYTKALSPEEAMRRFILREGFEIELFAAEPYVKDPVEMVVDENRVVYVVEMPDYPYKPEAGKQKSRIRVLEDRDGDGQIDHSIVFADKLMEATSVLPWDGGMIVTAAPDILYLKDTTGDFRADIQEVLFTGFFENNSEAQITNLRFNIDNWIYASNFGQAGKITSPLLPRQDTLVVNGGDFRFRLDTLQFEVAAGPTQFGQGIDDWGNRFVTQNSLHIRQIMIPWRYLHRHEQLPSTEAVQQISDHDPMMFQLTTPPYWREERTRRRQATYHERGLDRIEYAANNFTGATGTTVYHGDAFPDEFYGSVFIGDVAGNLVHRDVISHHANQVEFTAHRGPREQTREFMMSADPWFRPVNFYSHPDGNLYILDMYRQHIETPLSIPGDLKAEMDFYHGMDKGRIYRIISDSVQQSPNPIPPFSQASPQELSNYLTYENGWWRFTAHRVIVQQQDSSMVPYLIALLDHNKPQTRLHALYALQALSALTSKDIEQALTDPHPAVRRHAIALAEGDAELLNTLINRVEDISIQVRLQLALSLGEFDDSNALQALANLMEQDYENPWFHKAVLSSKAGASLELFTILEKDGFFEEESIGKSDFLRDYVFVASYYQDKLDKLFELAEKAGILDKKIYQLAMVEGVRERLDKTEDAKWVNKIDQSEDRNQIYVVRDVVKQINRDQEVSTVSQ